MTETTETPDVTPTSVPVSVFSLYGTDASLAENGKWFRDFQGTGIDLKIARFTSKRAHKARQAAEAQYRRATGKMTGPLPDEIAEKVGIEAIANGILLDWDNIYGDDGEKLVYSVPTARMVLTRLNELRIAIVQVALDMDQFRKAEAEETLGN